MPSLRMAPALWAAGLRSNLQYRVDFILTMAWGLIRQGIGFVLIWVILSRFQALAGWSLGEVAFLYGLRLVIHALVGLLTGQIWSLQWMVRSGDFDRYLVRPVPPLLLLLCEQVPMPAFGELLGGLVLFGAANTLVGLVWTPQALLYLVLALVGGTLVELAIRLLVVSFSFRVLSVDGLMRLLDGFFSDFGTYPLSIFDAALQFLLTFGIPVAFMAYFPAVVLLGRTGELQVHPIFAYGAPLAGVVWMALALYVFHREMRNYQSAGH